MGRQSGISHTCGDASSGELRTRVRCAYGLPADFVRERLRGERIFGVDVLDKPEADVGIVASVVGGRVSHGKAVARKKRMFYL